MTARVLGIVVILVLALTALYLFEPFLFMAVWYVPLVWLTCPQHSFMGGCGEVTAGFVLGRVVVVWMVGLALYGLWRAWTSKRE